MSSVLIIGFGKMGNIYSRYLNEFGVEWDYYDPYVDGGLKKLAHLNNYTHVMISTISEVHYESYKRVRELGFNGRVYIDKPVVVSARHLDVLEDESLFCGMTERYNPAVLKLKELLDYESLISIKFSRYSTVPENMQIPVLFDLGIHDLDLYLHLLDYNEYPNTYKIFKKSKTCYVVAEQKEILSIFEWSHESHRRERKITVLQNDIVYEVDLIDQKVLSYEPNNTIKNLYVDKDQPLRRIMKNFLFGSSNDNAKLSHEFMFDVMREEL